MDTSLSTNDLSNSTSVVPVDRRLRDQEPEIFSKLQRGQFRPKGENSFKPHTRMHAHAHIYAQHCTVLTVLSYILCSALAILKKHYHTLWRSFPDDHMMTLAIMCDSFTVHPEAIEMITRCRTSDEANRTILNYILFILKGDHQMMEFCNLMQKLINNPRLSKITGDLRNGTCMYSNVRFYKLLSKSQFADERIIS